jgi:cobalt-zinc-cadmium efflux system outer membrane protein
MSKILIILLFSTAMYTSTDSKELTEPVTADALSDFGESLELENLVDAVLAENLELKGAEAKADADRAKAGAAGFWPDPTLSVAVSNLPAEELALDRTPMSGIQLNITQKIPFPGKNHYRRKAAEAEADSTEQGYINKRNTLIKRTRDAYYDLYLIERFIGIEETHKAYLGDYARVAEVRYATGEGPIHDALRGQVEISLKTEELITLGQRREVAAGRINVLLGRPPTTELPPVDVLDLPELNYGLEELQNIALADSPAVRGDEYLTAQAEASRSLNKLEFVPDITVGIGYRIREVVPMDPVAGEDFWTFSLGLGLPVFSPFKQSHNLDVASASLEMTRAKLDDTKYKVLLDVQDLYLQLEEYRLKVELYEEAILPQAEQSLVAALAGYRAGKVDFLTLLDSEMMLLNSEKTYYRVQVNYCKKAAALEATVGTELF